MDSVTDEILMELKNNVQSAKNRVSNAYTKSQDELAAYNEAQRALEAAEKVIQRQRRG